MDTACAILAGGKSVRMGRDKATAAFKNATLIKEVYDRVKEVFDDIIIVSSLHTTLEGIDAPVVKDIFPLQGPIVGISTALIHSSRPGVFVVPCDMPFLSVEAIRFIISRMGDEDVTIPRIKGYYEPLHAIYRRSCLSHFLRLIGRNKMKIAGIFPYVAVKVVDDHPCFHVGDRLVFSNINTSAELAEINSGRGG